jgi:flagellar biosynthesis/type III secretory pathway protein FliH
MEERTIISLDYLKMTAAERATYDRFRDDRSDLDQVALTARAEGHAEGKVEGHAQGKAEGMAKVFELLEKGVSMAEAKKMLGID